MGDGQSRCVTRISEQNLDYIPLCSDVDSSVACNYDVKLIVPVNISERHRNTITLQGVADWTFERTVAFAS
jgi:hypothetical protein